MKKLIILLGMLLIGNKLLAPVVDEVKLFVFAPTQPYEKLWEAVCFVESSFNPLAVNESEGAYGISQIRQIKLDWYEKQTGIRYTLQDCFDKEISKSIFIYHMEQFSDPVLAVKRWNGSGRLTDIYYSKIQNYLNERV
jgi:soluble lytic murein transglycosylase-like protein